LFVASADWPGSSCGEENESGLLLDHDGAAFEGDLLEALEEAEVSAVRSDAEDDEDDQVVDHHQHVDGHGPGGRDAGSKPGEDAAAAEQAKQRRSGGRRNEEENVECGRSDADEDVPDR
jgi:hypothetical protein